MRFPQPVSDTIRQRSISPFTVFFIGLPLSFYLSLQCSDLCLCLQPSHFRFLVRSCNRIQLGTQVRTRTFLCRKGTFQGFHCRSFYLLDTFLCSFVTETFFVLVPPKSCAT